MQQFNIIVILGMSQTDSQGQNVWLLKDKLLGMVPTSPVNVRNRNIHIILNILILFYYIYIKKYLKMLMSLTGKIISLKYIVFLGFSSIVWSTRWIASWLGDGWMSHVWLQGFIALRSWLRAGWTCRAVLSAGRDVGTQRTADLCS